MSPPAVSLHGLTVGFRAGHERHDVVRSLGLELPAGATLGIVGESGSGKSITLRALMGLLPPSAVVASGSLELNGSPAPLTGRTVRTTRRRLMAMVFQDPLAALDPVMTIGSQIAEVPRRVFGESRRASRTIAIDLLRAVRIDEPEVRAAAFPHELSGGQRQRAVIAMALACRPRILLCDEPTSSLDVTIAAEILALLKDLREQSGLSMIFVSHDLAVVSAMADSLLVLRGGSEVETGPTADVLSAPRRSYTRRLLDAVLEMPPVKTAAAEARFDKPHSQPKATRLLAQRVSVTYRTRSSSVLALREVTLSAGRGRICGLVGESGSGKTTLAKVLTGQLRPDTGTVALDGEVLPHRRTRLLRSAVQLVFQDPYSSLDPRMTARQTLSELLRLVVRMPREQVERRCAELLAQVGLPESALDGYPGQFSGGQRQRLAIARALAVNPTVLVADEPTSALDVSVQAAVLDQLRRLRDDLGLTIVVISHDLAVIRHICDDVFVLRSGAVVESGTAADVLDRPRDPYTQQLIRAVPRLGNRPV